MMGVVVGPLIAGLAADSYGISSTVAAFAIIAMLVTASAMAAIEPNATCVGKSS